MRTNDSLICLLVIASSYVFSPAIASGRPPNIVVIVADDMRADLMGCAGNSLAQTPHLDSLARDGVRAKNMFVTTAICAASRASILTGLYERTHRFTFGTKPIGVDHWNQGYPQRLKEAGYRTGFVGKFGVEVADDKGSQSFDQFLPLNRTPYWKLLPDGTRRHVTDIEGDRAQEFIRSTPPDQPFCLSLCFNAPHAEDADPQQYFWTKESDELYQQTVFPVPKTMTSAFFARQPEFLKDSESRVRFLWRFDNPEKYQRMVRGYYRMISDVDRVIGRVRETLRDVGADQNTVILFTSDNGYFLGERGFADKWYIYEHSIRVPFLFYDPRMPADSGGRVIDPVCLNVDLAPTILELAGVAVPQSYQGRSLVKVMNGATPSDWREDFFYEHLFERHNIPKSEGVRTERYTYVRWFDQTPVVEELYDHQHDYEQEFNLIDRREYSEIAETLRSRTTQLRDQYGGPFVSNARDQ